MYGNILIYRIVNRLSMFMLISNIDFIYIYIYIYIDGVNVVNQTMSSQ